jgi:hypothetical protein
LEQKALPSRVTALAGGTRHWQVGQAHFTLASMAELFRVEAYPSKDNQVGFAARLTRIGIGAFRMDFRLLHSDVMKKLIKVGVVLIIVGALAAWAALYYLGSGGGELLKKYVGQQLQTVAGWYLNPKFSFEMIDYQYPKTFILTKMKLTDVDPADASRTLEVMSCDKLTLELGELPKVGGPLKIEKILLDHPVIRAVATEPGGAKFAGLSNLVKSQGGSTTTQPTTQAATAPATTAVVQKEQPAGTKLSEVFQIRLLKLIEGKIVYDPRIKDTQPMELDAINTTMNIEPTADGWYKMGADLGRAPIFTVTAKGKLNLDSMATDALDLKVSAKLGREQDQYLPPQLQQLLKQYEVQGQLDVEITGAVPVTDPFSSKLLATVKLADANVALGEYRIPIKSLTLPAKLENKVASINGMELQALDGTLKLNADVSLVDDMNANATIEIANMIADQLIRNAPQGNEQPPFAGRINSRIAATNVPVKGITANLVAPGSPDALPASWGNMTLNVDQATLYKIPVLEQLGSAVRGAQSLVVGGQVKPTDKVDLAVEFNKNELNFKQLNVVSSIFAVRGTGTMWLDQRINFKLNGGPIEKVQSMLGKEVGGVLGAVTDNLYAYEITNTTADPKIGVKVGGAIGENVGKVGGAIGDNVGKVGQGIGNVGKGIGDGVKGIFGGGDKDKDKKDQK